MRARTNSNAESNHGLIVLNAVLLGILGVITLGPGAGAQTQSGSKPGPNNAGEEQNARPRGSYTMVGGELPSGNSNAIWVLDTANQELLALVWDQSRSRIHGLGFRDLASDAEGKRGR